MPEFSRGLFHGASLSFLAAGFALWAGVSEARTTWAESSRDLVVLCAASALGAVSMIVLFPVLNGPGRPGAELTLVSGAILVGYLRRFGVLGTGVGSQIYIGQLLAFGAQLVKADLWNVGLAAVIAAERAVVPRVLSACIYVVAGSTAGTIDRVRRRIVETTVGVPLGVACLPLALHARLLIWVAAALAMIIYAMALLERYDIACAAYAFTLMFTLAATGEHALPVLAARA